MTRTRLVIAWCMFLGSTIGEAVTTVLWLQNMISTRALVGITLLLSWLALQFESFTALQVAHDRHKDAG